jgi:hypothetical protein
VGLRNGWLLRSGVVPVGRFYHLSMFVLGPPRCIIFIIIKAR